MICGDLNDYRERVMVAGDAHAGYRFEPVEEKVSCVDTLTQGGFCENIVERRPPLDRWTLYHTRGPQERHLCQLDYLLVVACLVAGEWKCHPRHRAQRATLAHRVSAGAGGGSLSAHRLGQAEGVRPLSGRRDAGHHVRAMMGFDVPTGQILPVEAVDVRLDPAPHPFEVGNRAAIAENWKHEIAANPALFNGTVVLLSELAYVDRRLAGRAHAVDFATFLYWRHEPRRARSPTASRIRC